MSEIYTYRNISLNPVNLREGIIRTVKLIKSFSTQGAFLNKISMEGEFDLKGGRKKSHFVNPLPELEELISEMVKYTPPNEHSVAPNNVIQISMNLEQSHSYNCEICLYHLEYYDLLDELIHINTEISFQDGISNVLEKYNFFVKTIQDVYAGTHNMDISSETEMIKNPFDYNIPIIEEVGK
jgi:hypothetical protein